jgi:hypothetical protein
MAGQREARFDTGPGYRAPSLGSPQPTVRTHQIQGRAAQYDTNQRGLSGLGDALSGFFQTGAKTVEALAEIDHRQELVKIERQNKALQDAAVSDHAAGTGPNPAYMGRQAYSGVYTDAAAAESARKGADAVREQLRSMPLDGTVNPRDIAEQVFRTEYGPRGTGNPEFDAAWVNTFRHQVEPMVVQAGEQVARTVEANRFQTIRSDAINTLLDPSKATPGALEELQAKVLVASRGDQAVADRQLETIVTQAFMNDGNTTAILNSMKRNGYAQRNPDSYLRLSEQAFNRTNAIKTWQAGTEVEQWGSDFDAAMRAGNGFVPLQDIVGFAARAYSIDSKHGVGSARFMDRLNQAWAQSAKTQAEVNVILTSLATGTPGALVAAANGVEISKAMEKHFDPAVAQFVQMNARQFPELSKTADGQMVNPLASPQAAKEYGRLIGQPSFVSAAPEGQSATYKSLIGNALLGTDPQAGTNAVHALAQYEALNGQEMTRKLVRSDDEWNIYVAAKTSGREYSAYFAARHENPTDTKLLDAANAGTLDWAKLLGKPDTKRGEIAAEVMKAQDAALLKSIGRDGWFRSPNVAMSDRMRSDFSAKMASFLAEQRRTGGALDVSNAAQHVLASLRTESTAIPGQDGSLVLYPKTRGLGGEVRDQPIKLPNGKDAYAPGKVRNYAEEEEDTLETWRNDMEALPTTLPGILSVRGVEHSADELYLDAPGASGIPGVHTVMAPGGQRLSFMPGRPFTTTRTIQGPAVITKGITGKRTETVNEASPTDPVEFEKYLAARLPKGFHLIPQHAGNGQVFYTLGYSFRLQKDREWFDTNNAANAAAFKQRQEEELTYRLDTSTPTTSLGMGIGSGTHPGSIRPHGF